MQGIQTFFAHSGDPCEFYSMINLYGNCLFDTLLKVTRVVNLKLVFTD